MKCLKPIIEIREFILANQEIFEDKQEILFISTVKESHSIYGGLGDSDSIFELRLDYEGWVERTYTNEYGHYANGTKFDKVQDDRRRKLTDEQVELFFNGNSSSINDFYQFINSSKEILSEYSGNNYKNKPSIFWPE